MQEQTISTFFMFNGRAEEAMNFYTSLFEGSEILHLHRQPNGKVLHAAFTLRGQPFMAIDNMLGIEHPFTPAMSLFVACETEEELRGAFGKLEDGGQALMPLGPIPGSTLFGWVQDRFGVSWQLSVPAAQTE
ncbi:VOC family protein [Paenibacillus sp. MWE-103]|uniref:VOC family protein n=1 Tax=Paenibacillus artemisiicola TaxID=1172618 RepID=A0ABS3WJR8_9BACL|nr:VOC family protein [Paenibacillus artemisiicola]MBO7748578.1 VOC family protein [Paenibacillus artemisiicola]